MTSGPDENLRKALGLLDPRLVALISARALRRCSSLRAEVIGLSRFVDIWLDEVVDVLEAAAEHQTILQHPPRTRNWLFAHKWIAELVAAARTLAQACLSSPPDPALLLDGTSGLERCADTFQSGFGEALRSSVLSDVQLVSDQVGSDSSLADQLFELEMAPLWLVPRPEKWTTRARLRDPGAILTIEIPRATVESLGSNSVDAMLLRAFDRAKQRFGVEDVELLVVEGLSTSTETELHTRLIEAVISPLPTRAATARPVLRSLCSTTSREFRSLVLEATSKPRRSAVLPAPRRKPTRDTQELRLDIFLDAGDSDEEDILELFRALQSLNAACGGSGLDFRTDEFGGYVLAGAIA